MKIAIATENGYVSAHFGRCPTYTLVDIEAGRVVDCKEIPNPGHEPGFLPQYLSERGVGIIIAGGMGPRAQGLFAGKNIEAIIGVQGPIDSVIDQFLRQELEAGRDLCDHGHGRDEPFRHGESVAETGHETPVEGMLCVSAKGPNLDAEIDPNFGRAPYFLIVDPETLKFEALANPHSQAGHGAGIQSAQSVASRGVSAILTGQVGPNAQRVLESAGIRIISAEKCTVREALSWLRRK
jgi:predicted Fe-Mo cluster-binding NifX family protein